MPSEKKVYKLYGTFHSCFCAYTVRFSRLHPLLKKIKTSNSLPLVSSRLEFQGESSLGALETNFRSSQFGVPAWGALHFFTKSSPGSFPFWSPPCSATLPRPTQQATQNDRFDTDSLIRVIRTADSCLDQSLSTSAEFCFRIPFLGFTHPPTKSDSYLIIK